jgi:hypothetical protein
MLPNKKTARLMVVAIAVALITLTLVADSFLSAIYYREHTCLLYLPASSSTLLAFIGSHLVAQVFLVVCIILYHRQSGLTPKTDNRWTKDLDWLDEDLPAFLADIKENE